MLLRMPLGAARLLLLLLLRLVVFTGAPGTTNVPMSSVLGRDFGWEPLQQSILRDVALLL